MGQKKKQCVYCKFNSNWCKNRRVQLDTNSELTVNVKEDKSGQSVFRQLSSLETNEFIVKKNNVHSNQRDKEKLPCLSQKWDSEDVSSKRKATANSSK